MCCIPASIPNVMYVVLAKVLFRYCVIKFPILGYYSATVKWFFYITALHSYVVCCENDIKVAVVFSLFAKKSGDSGKHVLYIEP